MAQGADTIIAHGKGSVWNTMVDVNVPNAGLLVNNWTIGNGLGPLVYSESLTGSGGRSNAIRGLTKLTGDVSTELRYSGLEHLFAQVMGLAVAPVTIDGTARSHVFNLANDVTGIFDSVAVMKNGPAASPALPVWRYRSVKWGGFVITFTADGLATMTVPAIASSCDPLTTTGLNIALPLVTYRTKALNVFGTHIQFLANPAADVALAAPTHQFYPSQIVLTFTRNLDSAYVMDGTGIQPEPYYTTFYDVTLSLTFPVYGPGFLQANNTFLANAFGEVPMKLIIRATSPVDAGATPGTQKYSWLFEFPNIILGDVQMPINDAGVIPQTVEMAALGADTAPLGMTALTQHFRATNVSQMLTAANLNP